MKIQLMDKLFVVFVGCLATLAIAPLVQDLNPVDIAQLSQSAICQAQGYQAWDSRCH